MSLSAWSRGMIPASGAGGPGFDPRSGPRIEIYFAEIHHGRVDDIFRAHNISKEFTAFNNR
jgi:hypothetical protein